MGKIIDGSVEVMSSRNGKSKKSMINDFLGSSSKYFNAMNHLENTVIKIVFLMSMRKIHDFVKSEANYAFLYITKEPR